MGLLGRLLGREARAPRVRRTVPDGERVYAIGDVHGHLDLLEDLLAQIIADHEARDPARPRLVFLGDLVDRGPASAEVVERVRTIVANDPDAVCLAGNHEELFLLALEGGREALKLFSRVGGQETMASYGIGAADFHKLDDDALVALMRERVPAAHVAFLSGLPDAVTIGDYHFVHAGIRPGVPLDQQKSSDLRWIRSPFLDDATDHGVVVVHGHTVVDEVEERDNRIGIDTGAYMGGALTALVLEGDTRRYLAAKRAYA